MPLREVQHTTDFDRIVALPRRRLTQADAEAWARELTPMVACRGADVRLRPWQACGIGEAVQNQGAFLGLQVGVGKTLAIWLLCYIMAFKRPLLVAPANQKHRMWDDFASYRGKWRTPATPPRFVSMQELALEKNERLIDVYQPDAVFVDEADEMANAEKGAPARLDRYAVATSRDECAFFTLTGTPGRKSLLDYWHLVCWALRDAAPLPMKHSEAKLWAAALDYAHPRQGRRPHPGPLGHDVTAARKWYRERLAETPGVVLVDGDSAEGIPLTIRMRVAQECRTLDEHFKVFNTKQKNPDGIPVSDPLRRWLMDGQLGCGLYSYWDPPPPDAWRVARVDVARFVRNAIKHSRTTSRPLDTEAQVLRRYADHPTVEAWEAIRDTFKERTKVRWLSSATLETAVAWLAESDEPGIVWCGGVDFAEALAACTRLSYYGADAEDQYGRKLHAAPPNRSFIASWHANKKGFNLQAWRRQAIFHPPQSAKWLEQIFGRSHRGGQTRPVSVDVFATSGGTIDGFLTAIGEAAFGRETFALTQKILRADVQIDEPHVTKSNRFRWAMRDDA